MSLPAIRDSMVGLRRSSAASSDRPIGPAWETADSVDSSDGVSPAPAEVCRSERASTPIATRRRVTVSGVVAVGAEGVKIVACRQAV